MKNLLSKSDFLVAQSCPTKLYYRKNGYPTNDSEEFMELLAEGGFYVGELAKLQRPVGIEIKNPNPKIAFQETLKLLSNEKITIFEATIIVNQLLVKIDVLEKDGNDFNIIEIKSKSYASKNDSIAGNGDYMKNKSGNLIPSWNDYVYDVAFQHYVFSLAFPEAKIQSFLLLPDKSKNTTIEGLGGMFEIDEKIKKVNFKGNIEEAISQDILTQVSVDQFVLPILQSIQQTSTQFTSTLKEEEITKIHTPISKGCKSCEFRYPSDASKDGFLECWGNLGTITPHIFDMYNGTTIQKGELFNQLIHEGKVSLFDVQPENLSGKRGVRQQLQLNNEEWIDPNISRVLTQLEYPLFFIDFETASTALPYHIDMSPYETVAFQWSCHVIDTPESEPQHFEWINTEPTFPNFRFAEILMEVVGDKGTPLMWSSHENTVLRAVYEQMQKRNYYNPKLSTWLEQMVKFNSKDTGRFVDMNTITQNHYFHPDMKGQTSIKATLPAIWNNNLELHEIPWFSRFSKIKNGEVLSPYKALEEFLIDGETHQVSHGTAAMRAYDRMLYGKEKDNPEFKEKWKKALLDYCQLDTLAMVIVWAYWSTVSRG
jgi:hypothetical protein